MQQALYNSIRIPQTNSTANTNTPGLQAASVLRWVSRKWDLVGVLTLMGASAAYGLFALGHLGL